MIAEMLTLSDRFCAVSGIAETTLSSRVFNDGKRISAVRSGKDIGARRLERAMQWFSDHWPAGLDWPAEVPRPAPQKIPEAAE